MQNCSSAPVATYSAFVVIVISFSKTNLMAFNLMLLQVNPDRTRWSGSTELMRLIGEARSIPFFPDRPIFMFTVVYGIVYTMRH